MNCPPRLLLPAALLLVVPLPRTARAIEVKVSARALERTAKAQLFNGPDGRYYMRGDAGSPCSVYAEQPHITFRDDRIVVRVHTRARLGTALRGSCLGVSLTTDAEVSLVPEAEGESIGFRDARLERMSDNRELNFLLAPFLSGKLPQQLKVNAADLMRKLLAGSGPSTGYALSLERLKLHSLLVQDHALILDADAGMNVD